MGASVTREGLDAVFAQEARTDCDAYTKWWRLAYERSKEVRLLPRVEFLHPDTAVPMGAPPGCGVTLFFLGRAVRQPAVHLATKRGLRALPGVEVDDE